MALFDVNISIWAALSVTLWISNKLRILPLWVQTHWLTQESVWLKLLRITADLQDAAPAGKQRLCVVMKRTARVQSHNKVHSFWPFSPLFVLYFNTKVDVFLFIVDKYLINVWLSYFFIASVFWHLIWSLDNYYFCIILYVIILSMSNKTDIWTSVMCGG